MGFILVKSEENKSGFNTEKSEFQLEFWLTLWVFVLLLTTAIDSNISSTKEYKN